MTNKSTERQSDIWSEWLLHRRHGSSHEHAARLQIKINQFADRVLDAASLAENMTLADIGSGDGLIAFRAIDRIGPSLKVILTDISLPILAHAQKMAVLRECQTQCQFLHCTAENLSAVADASVDVVMTRSVLAYVPDKKAALREFHRILKPGGRISLAEPVYRDDAFKILAMKNWIDDHPNHPNIKILRLTHLWKSAQLPGTLDKITANPLTNYSERDLFVMATECQFKEIHVELHLDSATPYSIPWEVYIQSAPHPQAPTLKEIMESTFSKEDCELFEQSMRPALEQAQQEGVERMVYVTAVKAAA